MTIAIVLCSLLGIALSNLAQWGKWIDLHKGEPKLGYWMQMGLGHLLGNLLFDAAILVVYSQGWLDEIIYRAGKPFGMTDRLYDGNIPVTPQLAIIVVGGADYFGDLVSFILGRRIRSMLPGAKDDSTEPSKEGK